MKPERYRVEVNGIVQGVGFRPFVFRLAERLSIKGIVRNTADGVLIEAEGSKDALEAFVSALSSDAPPLAVIDSVTVKKLDYFGYSDFSIRSSKSGEKANTLISPDISTCPDCRRELFDPADHRHLYPFINCTNCGPRFTIVCDVPYDRHNTTMKGFTMCPVCGAQYADPSDRRYHAQPLCCRECGPELVLTDAGGTVLAESKAGGKAAGSAQRTGQTIKTGSDPVRLAAELLAGGEILAVKSLGGYHLVCNAADSNAVMELRKRKYRDEKPFALMARDIGTARKYCEIDDYSAGLLQSPAAPIVLLSKRKGIKLPEQLAPGNPDLGIMLPYTPLHLLLFSQEGGLSSACPEILVMTSGNRSDEPICFRDEDAFEQLKGIADYFLTNNRPIRTRTDDSVVRSFRGREYFIRRSRGYAPAPVIADASILPENPPSVLALGGELKNTFCLTKGNRFFLSPHIGDLENMETLQAFEDGIEHYKRLFDIQPAVVTYDMHPAYLSTEYAKGLKDVAKISVQHHHAHIASCMAENSITGNVIGVAFDGTGFGEDGTIWGGEFFTGGYRQFKRAAYLEQFRLPGSDAAVKEPWRTAVSCLHQFGYDMELLRGIEEEKKEFLVQMLDRDFNSPVTSSMGRLFDAAAALTGIRLRNKFEGQAAIELEHAASGKLGKPYDYTVEPAGESRMIGIEGIIGGIVRDLAAGTAPGDIAGRFHGTIAGMIVEVCTGIRRDTGLDRVVLSGGVFQNMLLLSSSMELLAAKGFQVFIHRRVPTNDGGISLGQAVIALACSKEIW